MNIPTPGEAHGWSTVAKIALAAMENASGIAIFKSKEAQQPSYWLSMGVLDSLLRYDSWLGDPTDVEEVSRAGGVVPAGGLQKEKIRDSEVTFLGPPPPEFLPSYTARAIHWHLTSGWKMQDPRVSLLVVPRLAPSRTLVIGRKMSEFADPNTAARQIHPLLWYLPRNRGLFLMSEQAKLATMTPLTSLFPAAET